MRYIELQNLHFKHKSLTQEVSLRTPGLNSNVEQETKCNLELGMMKGDKSLRHFFSLETKFQFLIVEYFGNTIQATIEMREIDVIFH